MLVRFFAGVSWCQGSDTSETIDVSALGYTDDAWNALSDEDKQNQAIEWAWDQGLEIGFEELPAEANPSA